MLMRINFLILLYAAAFLCVEMTNVLASDAGTYTAGFSGMQDARLEERAVGERRTISGKIGGTRGVFIGSELLSGAENNEMSVQETGAYFDSEVFDELITRFRTATENFEEEIYVGDLGIKYDEANYQALYELLVFSSPRSYYLLNDNGEYRYFDPFYNETDGNLVYIYPI